MDASTTQKLLIIAVADAQRENGGRPVMIAPVAAAAHLFRYEPSLRVCARVGWLKRAPDDHGMACYFVTERGYLQIGRNPDGSARSADLPLDAPIILGPWNLPTDPYEARRAVERVAVAGRYAQYLLAFTGWWPATMRVDVRSRMGVAARKGERVLASVDLHWLPGGMSTYAIWAPHTGVKTSVHGYEIAIDERPATSCGGCEDMMIPGVAWPARDDVPRQRATASLCWLVRRCDVCGHDIGTDKAAADAVVEYLRETHDIEAHAREVQINDDDLYRETVWYVEATPKPEFPAIFQKGDDDAPAS